MKRLVLWCCFAILGLGIAVVVIVVDNQPAKTTQEPLMPRSPFKSYVAGAGVVEATTGNVEIGSPVSGIVTEIEVKVGDQINVGDPLFKIDDRDIQAGLVTARARVKEREVALRKPKDRLEIAERLAHDSAGAISQQDLNDRRDEYAEAQVALELARAQVKQLEVDSERSVVRALVAGEILQVNIHPGEFVDGSGASAPILLLGGEKRLNLRVDVDENDAWRVKAGAEAVAFVRGNPEIKIPLRYEYTEPYIIPKTALTGRSTERTDTRVLQVLYSFAPAGLPVHAGQQLDVFIQAPASGQTAEKSP